MSENVWVWVWVWEYESVWVGFEWNSPTTTTNMNDCIVNLRDDKVLIEWFFLLWQMGKQFKSGFEEAKKREWSEK